MTDEDRQRRASTEPALTRRRLLGGLAAATAASAVPVGVRGQGAAVTPASSAQALPAVLEPSELLGGLVREGGTAPLEGAAWYVAEDENDGLEYRFPAGTLTDARYLSADVLLDGTHLAVFILELSEGGSGPAFTLSFGALNQCAARVRMPLELVDQRRWLSAREGAWLKPLSGGDRVDPAKVDRLTLRVLRKSPAPVRWCLTPFAAGRDAPPLLTGPLLPVGPLLDELGQSTLHEWPAKSRDADEVTARLRAQAAAAAAAVPPAGFSRWGGWVGEGAPRFEATGYFRTHRDERRWWLVDPDGHPFWSTGPNSVRVDTETAYQGLETALTWLPERTGEFRGAFGSSADRPTVNYLAANLIRAFGAAAWRERWATVALAELRRLGFNTIANWSDWQVARDAGFPYVRPLEFGVRRTPLVFRDFPDVYHESFAFDARAFAEQLRETVGDPALIGYFLMNEPTWGFAAQTPAEGMLFATDGGPCREALAAFLRERHGDDRGLAAAWGGGTNLALVAEGTWAAALTDAARADLAAFSTAMVERLFRGLGDACRAVDPDHLNLGARYYTAPPPWALEGMGSFDVFSANGYGLGVRSELAGISAKLQRPVLIGEWHFGALDVGLPASGIGHVPDQAARGQAFRVYLEDAASRTWCVGAHWFILYDQSALGRFDGENYNIGFFDVCHRRYEPLAGAARAAHDRLYALALGEEQPYREAPEYLPLLFL